MKLGFAEGAQGIAQLVMALVAGLLLDRCAGVGVCVCVCVCACVCACVYLVCAYAILSARAGSWLVVCTWV